MRVLLAEAQALVREGLKHVTLQIDGTCEFVEAADAATARALLLGEPSLDVAWFDEALFAADEIAALRHVQPRLLLLALVASHNDGASAQIPRPSSDEFTRFTVAGSLCGSYGAVAARSASSSQ